ncbi:MAG: hypothetical protein NZ942_03055, partial [Candidatus Aenigmarchaeota archaeon]|nr:hypothetical protein [Candidatus Aenigmarchaeota archaeon]
VYKKLAYPLTVFIASLFLLIVNTLVIVPRILQSEMFRVVAASDTTKVTVAMLKTLSIIIPLVIFVLVVGVFLLSIWFRMNQRKVEMFLLKIPLLRELIFHRAFFISFFSISKLLLVGVKLSDALKIMERANTIKVIKEEFFNAQQCLKKGENLVNGFKHLTKLEKQILSLSLNVERLADNFEIVAKRFYNKHIETIKKTFPILYFVSLSLVVVVFMLTFLSVFLPYLKILTDIGSMR